MANNSRKSLSSFLVSAIANGRVTKMELHKSTKIGRPSINAYMKEEMSPTLDQLDRLADALYENSWDLIRGKTEQLEDPSLNRIIALWRGFNEEQRGLAVRVIEDIANVPHKPTNPISKRNKSSA